MLCQRNKFSCDSCSGLQEAEKRMKVKKLPNILALHLKRFKYQEEAQKFIKLSYRVAFPFELRLFNTVDDAENADRLYELFAIVVHIGDGPHHGHYTTLIRTQLSWFLYDDDNVKSVKESEIPRYFGESPPFGAGYVLFYQAVDMRYTEVGLHETNFRTSSPFKSSIRKENNTFTSSNDEIRLNTDVSLANLESVMASEHQTSLDGDQTPIRESKIKSSQVMEPSAQNNCFGDKEILATRLRHIKSEKFINGNPELPSSEQPPPVPTLTKRPKTGDGTSSGNRLSWLSKGKSLSKRSKEPPTSFPHLSDDGGIMLKQYHVRSHSTAADTVPAERLNLSSETKLDKDKFTGPNFHLQAVSRQGQHLTRDPPEKGSRSRPLNTAYATPIAPSLLPSPFESVRSNQTSLIKLQNSIPESRASSSPENELATHPPSSSHNLTDPIKKAVRKMSLNSMPLKFTSLGRKEKDR